MLVNWDLTLALLMCSLGSSSWNELGSSKRHSSLTEETARVDHHPLIGCGRIEPGWVNRRSIGCVVQRTCCRRGSRQSVSAVGMWWWWACARVRVQLDGRLTWQSTTGLEVLGGQRRVCSRCTGGGQLIRCPFSCSVVEPT